MLDLGLPLDAAFDDQAPPPAVPGLATGDPSLLGLLISHPHPDHYGLVSRAHLSIPMYIGEAARRLLEEAAFFMPVPELPPAAGFLRDRQPYELGPFRITPYLMDHSAFDSYALLVDAGGQRLLYSGDLRAHGRQAALFERFIAEPPANVDALLLEGTHIRQSGATSTPSVSEQELEDECLDVFDRTEGLVLACYSAQNIDRLMTLYRAAQRSGRLLVLDLYTALIARATDRPDVVPQADWEDVRVFVPLSQRIRVKREHAFERINWVRPHRLFPEELGPLAHKLVVTFRSSMANEFERANCLAGARVLWSMWPGYLDESAGASFGAWLADRAIPRTLAHSSGHASVADLQRFASAVAATQVVPIHTNAPDRFPSLIDNVRIREDGEWWGV